MQDDDRDKLREIFAGEEFQAALREAAQIVGYQGRDDPRPLIHVLIHFTALGVLSGWKNPRPLKPKRGPGRRFGSGRNDPEDLELLRKAETRKAANPDGHLRKILLQIVRKEDADNSVSAEARVKRVMRLKRDILYRKRRPLALALDSNAVKRKERQALEERRARRKRGGKAPPDNK